jgi:two-component system, NtrC family, response regulator AtoC
MALNPILAHGLNQFGALTPEPTVVIGNSPSMRVLHGVVGNLAGTEVPVMILGESGTGKRSLAVLIHKSSPRASELLLEVECRRLNGDAFEARSRASGQASPFSTAGTLLLIEVADLSAAAQSRLAALLTRNESPNNALRPRIIATSRKDLDQEIRLGRFREDLYYRFSGVCLRIPPLRHRREDLPLLTEFFLDKYSRLFSRPRPQLTPQLLRFLSEMNWTRNVTELEDVIRTVVAVGDVRIATTALKASVASSGHPVSGPRESVSLKEAAKAASHQAERELILKVLTRTQWNRKRAAQELKISYKALLYKMKQIGCTHENGPVQERGQE